MALTRKVLLLNASYEALGVVNIPRAIRLVWKGSAEVVELDGGRVLRSQRFVFPSPSVIRLISLATDTAASIAERRAVSSTLPSTTSCLGRGAGEPQPRTFAPLASLAISERAIARPRRRGCRCWRTRPR
jgi:hypothetical protein